MDWEAVWNANSDQKIRKEIISTILPVHLNDSIKKRILTSDGTYIRAAPEGEPLNAQEWLIAHRGIWNEHLYEENGQLQKNIDI